MATTFLVQHVLKPGDWIGFSPHEKGHGLSEKKYWVNGEKHIFYIIKLDKNEKSSTKIDFVIIDIATKNINHYDPTEKKIGFSKTFYNHEINILSEKEVTKIFGEEQIRATYQKAHRYLKDLKQREKASS